MADIITIITETKRLVSELGDREEIKMVYALSEKIRDLSDRGYPESRIIEICKEDLGDGYQRHGRSIMKLRRKGGQV